MRRRDAVARVTPVKNDARCHMLKRAIGTPRRLARTFSPAHFLATITAGKSSRQYRPNQGVFSQGDDADAVFYLQRGRVKLTVVSVRGNEAVLGVLGRGAFFGENCLAVEPLRKSTARAVVSSTIVRVAKKTMVALLHREPEFAELFTAHLLSRRARIEGDLIRRLFNSSEKRLARALLSSARFGETSAPDTVIPKVSREVLASRIGTTPSKVTAFMRRFRRMGFIDYAGGGLTVHNSLLDVLLYD
jgi:CRP/FNR family cyclic AMP-dependent transcriptional regulator